MHTSSHAPSHAKWTLALFSICGLALAALADPPNPSDPVLGGPKVKELGTPGASRTLDGKPNEMRKGVPEMPQVKYMEILRSTLGPSASGTLQLNAAQQEKIKAADQEFHQSQSKYLGDNGKDAKELRRKMIDSRGKKPDANAATTPDANATTDAKNGAALEQAKKLREGAPRASEAQAKIWSYLTPEQQGALKPKLDAALEQIVHDRSAKEAERKTEKKLKDQKAKEANGQAPEIKGKALERFKNATPEEQAEMKAKLQARLAKMPEAQKQQLLEKLKAQGIDPASLEKSGDK